MSASEESCLTPKKSVRNMQCAMCSFIVIKDMLGSIIRALLTLRLSTKQRKYQKQWWLSSATITVKDNVQKKERSFQHRLNYWTFLMILVLKMTFWRMKSCTFSSIKKTKQTTSFHIDLIQSRHFNPNIHSRAQPRSLFDLQTSNTTSLPSSLWFSHR